MFSSLFGKRRSSPAEDDVPPIPGARQDDGFFVVDPTSPTGGIYPNVSGGSQPYPQRPAPPAPVAPKPRPLIDPTFHYLQGVPFTLAKELQLASNKGAFVASMGNILSTSRFNIGNYDYDFSIEKSVLKEC